MLKSYDPKTVEKIKKAREERKQIVEKYDKGREDGAVIDDWEDPKFEIYHQQDRYGFIHDQRLPEIVTRTAREQKALDKEMSRVDKWLVMINEKDKWFPSKASNHKKLAERVWKGVPGRMRGEVWRILLNVDQLREKNEGIYEKMRLRGRSHSKEVRQIDLDVNRTYRDHIMFRERYNIKQKDLFHVLTAYSMYNTEVSYCQGMSQVAALLLMFLNTDEDAFWGLHQLMVNEKYNMHAFFIPAFPKLQRFQDIHDKVLLKKLKKVQKHLLSNGMDTGIYSIKWFLQCFLDRIPFSLSLRVWDIFLLEGDQVILAMAFNILKLHQKNILKLDMEQLMEFFQKGLTTDFGFEDEVVIESLKDCLSELKSSKLLWIDPIPKTERPQVQFGDFDLETYEIDLKLEDGERSAVNEGDRHFLRNTLQREQDNLLQLRHIDSQDSIDDIDEETDASLDKSVSFEGDLSDHSSENDETTPTKVEEKQITASKALQTSLKQLDKSLEYLMHQVDLADKDQEPKYNKEQGKHIIFVDPVERPASAGPVSGNRRRKNDLKRMSSYIPQPPQDYSVTTVTSSHRRPCSSAQVRSSSQSRLIHRHSSGKLTERLTTASSSSSSRDINLSSDSVGAESRPSSANKPQYPKFKPHHYPPQRSLSGSSRSESKNSYYYGENLSRRQSPLTPELKSKPRSRYYFGDSPDLQEILQNLNNFDDTNDIDVFEDVMTPVNEPPPEFQDPEPKSQDRQVTRDQRTRQSSSARTKLPTPTTPKSRSRDSREDTRVKDPDSRDRSRANQNCDNHFTFSAVNSRVQGRRDRDRNTSDKQYERASKTGHRTTHNMYVADYQQQYPSPSSRRHQLALQCHNNSSHNYISRDQSLRQHSSGHHHNHHHSRDREYRRQTPPRDHSNHRQDHSHHRQHKNESEVWQRRNRSSSKDLRNNRGPPRNTSYSEETHY